MLLRVRHHKPLGVLVLHRKIPIQNEELLKFICLLKLCSVGVNHFGYNLNQCWFVWLVSLLLFQLFSVENARGPQIFFFVSWLWLFEPLMIQCSHDQGFQPFNWAVTNPSSLIDWIYMSKGKSFFVSHFLATWILMNCQMTQKWSLIQVTSYILPFNPISSAKPTKTGFWLYYTCSSVQCSKTIKNVWY